MTTFTHSILASGFLYAGLAHGTQTGAGAQDVVSVQPFRLETSAVLTDGDRREGTAGDVILWGAGLRRDTLGQTGNDIVGAEHPTTDRPNRAKVSDLQIELEGANRNLLSFAWSPSQPRARRPNGLRGPDGFDQLSPLVVTGKVNANYLPRLAAVTCGGFQHLHGVFHSGRRAGVNNGSYYGFIENGVVMSGLNPGLATAISYIDGRFDTKTWTEKDNQSLSKIRSARQNGRRHLIYGYFSSANPDAMAQVFRSYNCQYAIQNTNMNVDGKTIVTPRYVGRSDEANFFCFLRKSA